MFTLKVQRLSGSGFRVYSPTQAAKEVGFIEKAPQKANIA